VTTFEIEPLGQFSLPAARDFAGGFPAGIGAQAAETGLLATFPLEGWAESAAVNVWQTDDGIVHGEVHGTTDVEVARQQVARSLSLDHDGAGWTAVGERDPVLGEIGRRLDWLRPVCFYSAYEAATSFVIGHRISMRQGRVVKDRLAEALGDPIEIAGTTYRPFPRPQRLLEANDVQGLTAIKLGRIRDLARAALDGRLDTERLRSIPEDVALAELRELPGVGPWTAQAILTRGCGVADALPVADDISRAAVAAAYGLPEPPDDAGWERIADAWRPYRMWASVLLHVAWRRDQPSGSSYRQRGSYVSDSAVSRSAVRR
jgi:DNA-3-methyladenine glycosylase II